MAVWQGPQRHGEYRAWSMDWASAAEGRRCRPASLNRCQGCPQARAGCRCAQGGVQCCSMIRRSHILLVLTAVWGLSACDLIGLGDSEPVGQEVAAQADVLSDQASKMSDTADRAAERAASLKETYDELQKEADEAKAEWEAMAQQAKDLKAEAAELKKRADALSKRADALNK